MATAMPKHRVAVFRYDLLALSETFIRSQALGLTHWHPILVGRRREDNGLSLDGIETHVIPQVGSKFRDLEQRARFWLNQPDSQLARGFGQVGAHLVHAHFGTDATSVWPSIKAIGLPMLVTLHGNDINIDRKWWEEGHGGLRRRTYPRRLLTMALEPRVNFIAVSKAIKQRAIEYGIPARKIQVHYIGVDTELFKPCGLPIQNRRRRILFVGRMVEKKAPHVLIHAFAQTREKVPDAELIMIGDGPLLESSKRLAKELGAPVVFLGARPQSEVLAQMHESRAFCLPSVTAKNGDAEGFGMVLLEAQACGVPVVSSARGGATEGIVDGRTGFSIGERSADDLASKLAALLLDDELATRMSKAAVHFIRESFDLNRQTSELERIYDHSISPAMQCHDASP